MSVYAKRIEEIRDAMPMSVEHASVLVWLRAAEASSTQRDHEDVVSRLLRVDRAMLSQTQFESISLVGLHHAIVADTDCIGEFFDGLDPEFSPYDDLAGEFLSLSNLPEPVSLRRSDELRKLMSSYPWATYTWAHLRDDDDASVDVIDTFDEAAARFEEVGEERMANHCRLRSAALRIRTRQNVSEGRKQLKRIAKEELPGRDLLWMCFAWAKSTHWLDRVRCIDTLDELSRKIASSRPEVGDLKQAEVDEVWRVLLALFPFDSPHDEDERLRDVIASMSPAVRTESEALLDQIAVLSSIASDSIFTEDVDLDLWRTAAPKLSVAVLDAAHGRVSGLRKAGFEGLATVFSGLKFDDVELLNQGLEDLDKLSAEHLWMLAPFWSLLSRTKLELEAESLSTVANRFAQDASSTSVSWWQYAALFHKRKWRLATCSAVSRAIADDKKRSSERDGLVAYAMTWSCQNGSDAAMIKWLDIGRDWFAD